MKVIVIGGGWSGCSAAIMAKKAGAEVEIYEKTDLLLGLGNVGGIMRNNGRFTAAEELIALGAGDLIQICDKCARHKNVDFPGHKHATLYDVNIIEGEVRDYIKALNIKVRLESRIVDVEFDGKRIKWLYLSDGTKVEGDVFIETTGSTGPMGNCLRYGNGCSMCILRCPAFGPRISISQRCNIDDIRGERQGDELGAFSGSCKLAKESLSKDIIEKLDKDGVVVINLPKEQVNYEKLDKKVCQQYALKEFAENIVLLDTGHAKLMSSFYNLEKLRMIEGLEKAKYVDPYAGSKGNSIRYLSVAPRTNEMQVEGVENLFCGGEKSGLFVGHTEAMTTGALAGLNAVRWALGMKLLTLPRNLAIGDLIAFANEQSLTSEGRKMRYTFAGSVFFNRMKENNLYTIDIDEIKGKIEKMGLTNLFNEKIF
ncbi:FAD-dependent oxidoreductase [uncultured Clostridium sp.]|uniref:FAD-dependent oxidoreductase n=1 Tax=uncultured Clostridium sp. TaxID=59620 RepID=UPI002608BDE8|nr:FAD-dependent oxidoreductase [uncultured Clostridium sp.]